MGESYTQVDKCNQLLGVGAGKSGYTVIKGKNRFQEKLRKIDDYKAELQTKKWDRQFE